MHQQSSALNYRRPVRLNEFLINILWCIFDELIIMLKYLLYILNLNK